jgi:ethylbenzene dioxygenase subunit beta
MTSLSEAGTATRHDVASFLALEAQLLDTRAFDEWLALWTPDARYRVPGGPATSEGRRIALIDDDRQVLEDRVFRMSHPASHVVDPPPTAVRLVGNVVVEPSDGVALEARSAYVLVVNRLGEQATFAARQRHRLVERDGGLAIAVKQVELTCGEDALRNLTFLP